MKKIIAITAALALAACGGNEVEETDTGMANTDTGMNAPMPAPTTASVAGTYTGTTEDGEQWSSTINDDGTYEDRMGGELIETGTWSARGEQTCFMQETVEGDPAATERCFTFGEPDAEGNIVFTNPEGQEMTVRKQMS